jgi:hypothetical protein
VIRVRGTSRGGHVTCRGIVVLSRGDGQATPGDGRSRCVKFQQDQTPRWRGGAIKEMRQQERKGLVHRNCRPVGAATRASARTLTKLISFP